jgi:kynurenine formamidase
MQGGLLAGLAESIANGSIRVIDLTQTLHPSTPINQLPCPFAHSDPFLIHGISRYDESGPAWDWNNFSSGGDTGIHSDASSH